MDEQHSGRRPRRYFSPEFKSQTVELVRETGKSISKVARDLDLTESAVREWVRQADVDDGRRGGLTTDEKAELARLRLKKIEAATVAQRELDDRKLSLSRPEDSVCRGERDGHIRPIAEPRNSSHRSLIGSGGEATTRISTSAPA